MWLRRIEEREKRIRQRERERGENGDQRSKGKKNLLYSRKNIFQNRKKFYTIVTKRIIEYNQLMSPRGNGIDVKFIKFLNSRGPKLISYNVH